ncbi:MAG: LysR family transcriptional regulator [Gammaproteobacteria bacterium]|nr:MAG: LysR family transcriptional regulator [Gammaproteobacteria bacterium]
MAELDLNLLYVLVALDERRSVSGAARKLHRSQPGVSVALGRLRDFFGDPLFVRSGNGMQPTPRATTLIESARAVLARIGSDIVAEPQFDPSRSSRAVTLVLSDVGEVVLLPTLIKRLRELMPDAMVRSVTLPPTEVALQLESGEVDLAIGYFPDLKKYSFYQQALYTDTFASLIRSDHRMQADKLSIREYLQLEHAVVRAESRTEEVIESYLARRKIRRQVVLSTPHFASAPIIVAQSDLIVTIPEPLARYFSSVAAGVRVVQLPFDPPRIAIKQFWHRKFHHDARSRWLRALVCELFQEQP